MYTNRLRPETAHSPSCRAPSNSTAKATGPRDRKSTRLNSSHSQISYAVFCLKKKIDPAFMNQPTEHLGRTISAVGGHSFGIEPDLILDTLDNGAHRADLVMPDRAACLDIDAA